MKYGLQAVHLCRRDCWKCIHQSYHTPVYNWCTPPAELLMCRHLCSRLNRLFPDLTRTPEQVTSTPQFIQTFRGRTACWIPWLSCSTLSHWHSQEWKCMQYPSLTLCRHQYWFWRWFLLYPLPLLWTYITPPKGVQGYKEGDVRRGNFLPQMTHPPRKHYTMQLEAKSITLKQKFLMKTRGMQMSRLLACMPMWL